jgi:cation diffusion facilitator family transporter
MNGQPAAMYRAFVTRFAWLSIGAAIVTITLKTVAYFLTGSVGLLSDALESLVNLAGGVMALAMLAVAARPPDEDHAFGHTKAEYFSSVLEGSLILVAAVMIAVVAVGRFINPRPLEQLGLGLGISVVASLVNLGVALVLLRAGRRYSSITLEANAQHLLTDVWTAMGVLFGVGAVAVTGWIRLDPIVALIVAANIVFTGVKLVRRSLFGLMDAMLPAAELRSLQQALERHTQSGVQYHALRTRQSGARRFVSLHVLVPGTWTVHQGHQLLEQIEADVRDTLPNVTVFTHLESLDDPASWDDMTLDRVVASSKKEPS